MFIAKIIGKDFHNKSYINVNLWKMKNTCGITQLNVDNIYVM